ncbi:MAG: crotonase [Bdellovibrionaceae bacterium]|nr:crotonase [Pseudobdellovibrionaceae bacterium]
MNNIKVEDRDHGIRVILIDRPKALNALNTETLLELQKVLKETAVSSEIRVVVLTGGGEKAFIAGADITEMMGKNLSQGISFAKVGQEVTRLLESLPQPTIAMVGGFALGGGAEMAIACDFIYASDSAVFGQPEVGLGVIPGFGGTARLSRFVGLPMAKDLIFSGRKIKSDEALRIGLVNEVVKRSELNDFVMKRAQQIASHSAGAVRACKRVMNEFEETHGIDYKLDMEAQEFGSLFGTKDQKEGMSAFMEKRKPNFEGVSLKESK